MPEPPRREFGAYLKKYVAVVRAIRKKSPRVLLSRKKLIQRCVKEAEKAPEFARLVDAAAHVMGETPEDHSPQLARWMVKLYARHSEIYTRLFDGGLPDRAEFAEFHRALTSDVDEVLYLTPLPYIRFSKPKLTFAGFWIEQFSRDDLDSLLRNRSREIFFPGTELDVDRLCQ